MDEWIAKQRAEPRYARSSFLFRIEGEHHRNGYETMDQFWAETTNPLAMVYALYFVRLDRNAIKAMCNAVNALILNKSAVRQLRQVEARLFQGELSTAEFNYEVQKLTKGGWWNAGPVKAYLESWPWEALRKAVQGIAGTWGRVNSKTCCDTIRRHLMPEGLITQAQRMRDPEPRMLRRGETDAA